VRRLRIWSLVALAAGALAFGTSLAGATVVDKGFYSLDFTDSYDDCGFEVAVEGSASGHFRVRAGKGNAETFFFASDNYSYEETHTNVETGEFFTLSGNAIFNEMTATRVSGSIFEVTAVEAGQPFVVRDSDGNVVLRDRGSIHHHALFDTQGDDVPGGIFIEELEADVHGPHPGFVTDFCEIITPLIGS
jgi:hypothetical protein